MEMELCLGEGVGNAEKQWLDGGDRIPFRAVYKLLNGTAFISSPQGSANPTDYNCGLAREQVGGAPEVKGQQ